MCVVTNAVFMGLRMGHQQAHNHRRPSHVYEIRIRLTNAPYTRRRCTPCDRDRRIVNVS
jgi:hypothetical protein